MRKAGVAASLAGMAVLAAAAAGCGQRSPRVAVAAVTLGDSSDEAQVLQFQLDLENRGSEPLRLREFRYRLSLDGKLVFDGRRAAEATLGAGATRRVEVPAVVRYDRVGWTARDRPAEVPYTVSGSLMYISPGELAEILFDTGVRKPTVGFGGKGILRLSGAE
jgi:hypothetical protein